MKHFTDVEEIKSYLELKDNLERANELINDKDAPLELRIEAVQFLHAHGQYQVSR